MKVSYEWLQTFFLPAQAGEDGTLPSAADIEQKLMFHAYEVEGVEDVAGTQIIDIDVLPNRAADSLSHRGIAREISTVFDIPMKRDPLREAVALTPTTDTVSVELAGDASCSYYIAAHMKGVKVSQSPEWLRKRLEAIGQRSINNVVDATNYVLFDLGRPTHVFDAKKFKGDIPRIGTRLACEGEIITLLGGEEVALTNTMTVITDVVANVPVAIGGIKGGAHAEVDEGTTSIIIETANFNPTATRLTAQALKLRTDASARFENNMADELADYGVAAVVKLILEIAGGELVGYATAGAVHSERTTVTVEVPRISKLLGADIDITTITSILDRLQFEYVLEGDVLTVTAPFERRDICIPEDVIEEIGRVYGYNNIKSQQLGEPERKVEINQKYAYAEKVREVLATLGYTEVYLYSLRDGGEVALRNSLASDKDHLRANLADGVREALVRNMRNAPLLGTYDAVRLFEIGNVFTRDGEATHVCVGVNVVGAKKKEDRMSEELKKVHTALEEALGTSLPQPENGILEFDLEALADGLPKIDAYIDAPVVGALAYTPASTYPFVLRDIAVWVPEGISGREVVEAIKESIPTDGVVRDVVPSLQRIDAFDSFEKDGRISYAFHLVFQSNYRTLTDVEVNDYMQQQVEKNLVSKGWEVR